MPSIERLAVVANDQADTVEDAVKRVEEVARAAGVKVVRDAGAGDGAPPRSRLL